MEHLMITSAECRARLSECKELGCDPNISMQRATAIMGVCRAWIAMDQRVAEYTAILVQEENEPHRA